MSDTNVYELINKAFDLHAMTSPKTRQDAMLLAREIIDQLELIEECIDAAMKEATR